MLVLVTYDVSRDEAGRRKTPAPRRQSLPGLWPASAVFGVRDRGRAGQWTALKVRLEGLIDPAQDSLRYYYLGANWRRRVEHVGAKAAADLSGPLIV